MSTNTETFAMISFFTTGESWKLPKVNPSLYAIAPLVSLSRT